MMSFLCNLYISAYGIGAYGIHTYFISNAFLTQPQFCLFFKMNWASNAAEVLLVTSYRDTYFAYFYLLRLGLFMYVIYFSLLFSFL